MYDYVEDKEFLSRARSECSMIVSKTVPILKEKYGISANFTIVGSGARNLILQNGNEPIDFDYNLEIVKAENINDGRYIKECVRKSFDIALSKYGWPKSTSSDSTSVLSTSRRVFPNGNKTEFSIDLAITTRDDKDTYYRLIHKKTGITLYGEYYWNEVPSSKNVKDKSDVIKKNNKWSNVREEYKKLKNHYLVTNDYFHPSFICYVEAVNNVYNTLNNKQKSRK